MASSNAAFHATPRSPPMAHPQPPPSPVLPPPGRVQTPAVQFSPSAHSVSLVQTAGAEHVPSVHCSVASQSESDVHCAPLAIVTMIEAVA